MEPLPIDHNTLRNHLYMADVARHVEQHLHGDWSFNIGHLGNPADPRVQKALDRRILELLRKDEAGQTDLNDMFQDSSAGAAWIKAITTAANTIAEIEALPPGSHGLVDMLIEHADLTNGVVTTPVKGAMIPENLLTRMTFRGAELAAVNRIVNSELVDAVRDRIEHINPDHPTKRLVGHVSLFLSMVAASPRDAENAINMASAFLKRFADEDRMSEIATAVEEAADADELHRCWILSLMTNARFRMAEVDFVISARPDRLTLVEVTDGVIRDGAATVSVPLEGYAGGTGRGNLDESSTRH